MSAPTCPHFDACNAPICPLDEASLSGCSWFPGEELCRRRDLAADWMARARKIARRVGNDPDRGSFTPKILSRNFRITSEVRGLDPNDGPITAESVARWLGRHPEIPALSEDQRQKARHRMLRARQKQRPPRQACTLQADDLDRAEMGSEAKAVSGVGEPDS